MFTFWTVTNANTSHTNEQSSRYGTMKAAIAEATRRINSGRTTEVVILQAVRLVRTQRPEIEVLEITEAGKTQPFKYGPFASEL